ncbi:MAG: hypothetical protein IIA87_01645 [Nanoarchaeota archaeon]|nr:hypothetical protein [Nanoarchaeota archaeon]
MGLFRRKKGSEVIDFTNLYNRELIKQSGESAENDVVDLSTNQSQDTFSNSDDFLSGLAGVGAVADTQVQTSERIGAGPITSSLRKARQESNIHAKFNEIKLKIDDTDYKLNNLIEKVKEIEHRVRKFKGI